MKISRRQLLGAAATSALLIGLPVKAWRNGIHIYQPQVQYGALSGGGFAGRISISNDGATMVINYDGNAAYIWNTSTLQWDNLFSQSRMPAAYQVWGQSDPSNTQGFTAPLIAVAPTDASRLYCVATNGAGSTGQFWKSTNRGVSWTDTGFRFAVNTTNNRGIGPSIAVDPNNEDVVYLSDNSGVVHVTLDAGTTFTAPSAVSSLLINVAATANTAKGGTVLTVGSGNVPSGVSTRNGYQVFCSDVSRADGITNADYVNSTSSTTITLIFGIQGATGVQNGDILVFGASAGIAFDPSGGTTTVSGKTVTKNIYIGWAYGASAVYKSTDGGQTWTATSGGPAQTRFLACDASGNLYACDYTTSGQTNTTNAWKYASGTWTNFSIAGFSGNNFNSCAVDPLNAGHVVFMNDAGSIFLSADSGSTWYSALTGSSSTDALVRSATDVPWLGPWSSGNAPNQGTVENYMSNGMCLFDPVSSGKLWIVEGVGCWYCTPPVDPGSRPIITATSQNKNQQSLIVTCIVKPPGNPLICSTEDRVGIYLPSAAAEPIGDFGIFEQNGGQSALLKNGWGVCYALSLPSTQFCYETTSVWKSTNSGQSWSNSGIGTITNAGNGASIAAQTPNNIVAFTANALAYTTNGGSSWSPCTFYDCQNINAAFFAGNRQILVADPVNNTTYYAFSYTAAAAPPTNSQYYGAFSIGIASVGSGGYSVNDVLGCSGGTQAVAPQFTVTSVDGSGNITGIKNTNCGKFSGSLPSSPLTLTGGMGSGATLNCTFHALGGLWRSTDSGATWANMSGGTQGLFSNSNANWANLVAVPGNSGHLFYGNGNAANDSVGLLRTTDAGATWHKVTNTGVAWLAAIGAAQGGGGYPSVFFAGTTSTDADAGVWRADNFTTDPSVMPTWNRMSKAPAGNMDTPLTMCGDLETWGKFYIGFGTGYVTGAMI